MTLACATIRADPRIDWTIESIRRQEAPGDQVEILVVDAEGRAPEDLGCVAGGAIASVTVTRPKPTPWQGSGRVTRRDWWACASARNTAIALCRTDYIAFVDDRCRLGDDWMAALRDGERTREAAIAGSYQRAGDGIAPDHRRDLHPAGLRDCGGGWLYGCTFALPLEWCLEINGFEEGCDGMSGEDCIFGLMLANAGHRIDFDPRLLIRQDRSTGTEHNLVRAPKGVPTTGKSMAAIARFGRLARTEFTPDLRALRDLIAAGGEFPAVDPDGDHRDWHDGRRLQDLP